jgi:hypothetical protein
MRKSRDQEIYILSREELKRLNAELKPKGAKLCNTCGSQYPLTEDYWYFSAKGRDKTTLYSSAACRKCSSAKISENSRGRYKTDESYRDYKADYRRDYFADETNAEQHRQRNRKYMAAKRKAQKRQAFEQLLTKPTEEV